MVIFLTDGRPTRGDTNREQILSNVRAQNEKGVAIYGLAFGQDADWPLVKRLALQNEGVGRRIYQDSDASLQVISDLCSLVFLFLVLYKFDLQLLFLFFYKMCSTSNMKLCPLFFSFYF